MTTSDYHQENVFDGDDNNNESNGKDEIELSVKRNPLRVLTPKRGLTKLEDPDDLDIDDDDDDDDGKDEMEPSLSQQQKQHKHKEEEKEEEIMIDDDENEDNDISYYVDDEIESSLNLEKEEVGSNANGANGANGSKGFFVSRREKLLAKFPPKPGMSDHGDTLSACEERALGVRLETNFGIDFSSSKQYDASVASFFRNQPKLFVPKTIPGSRKIPVTISNEITTKRFCKNLNEKNEWNTERVINPTAGPDSAYYEVVIEKIGDIRVGYAFECLTRPYIEYLGATGELRNGNRITPYGYPFKPGDTIGCGVIATDDCNVYAYFVHNGRPLHHVLCRAPRSAAPMTSITMAPIGCRMVTRFTVPPTWRGEPLADRLLFALDNPQYFPDVCFCFRNSPATILAHRAIIAARCPPLARRCRFVGAAEPAGPVEFVMLDEDAEVFRRLLRYAYSGRVSVADKGELEELFCLASRVGYESLALRCSECLEKATFIAPNYSMRDLLDRAFGSYSTEKSNYTRLFLEKDISIEDFIEKGVEAVVPRDLVPPSHIRVIADTLNIFKDNAAFMLRKTVAEPPWVLERDIHRMLKSPQFADIRISVGSESFMAHRVILAATGEYFKSLLQKPFVTSRRAGGSAAQESFCLAQEHTVGDYVFSTRYGSPASNPDLFIGDKPVPLDMFMEQTQDGGADNAIKFFSSDDVSIRGTTESASHAPMIIERIFAAKKAILGIFKKAHQIPNTVERCFLCKAFVFESEMLSMGACHHLICRSCFLNKLCAGATVGAAAAAAASSAGQGAYRTIKDYIQADPNPRCPCGNCSKKISWGKILAYLRVSENDPIGLLYAIAGTEKLRNAEVRREGLPVSLSLTGGSAQKFSPGAFRCYLSYLYSGYNRNALKTKYVWELSNMLEIFPDSQLVAVLRRMAYTQSESTAESLAVSYWLSKQEFYTTKNGGIDVCVYLMNNFEEFVIRFSRYPKMHLDAIREINGYMQRVLSEKEKYPYVVLYAHYTPNKGSLNIDESAFRASSVAPRDALIKYYIGKRLGFEDLRERARGVILDDRRVDPAAPSFVKTFGFFGKKCKREIVEEFVGVVKARMETGRKKGDEKACCVCGKNAKEKVKCCVCGRVCCKNFEKEKNCSASLPNVPPEMGWVEAPGIACTLCRKVAIICFLN